MNTSAELFTARIQGYENGHDDAFKSLIKGIEIMEKYGTTTLSIKEIKDLIISCREAAGDVKILKI